MPDNYSNGRNVRKAIHEADARQYSSAIRLQLRYSGPLEVHITNRIWPIRGQELIPRMPITDDYERDEGSLAG